jgi:hypothetical protein
MRSKREHLAKPVFDFSHETGRHATGTVAEIVFVESDDRGDVNDRVPT